MLTSHLLELSIAITITTATIAIVAIVNILIIIIVYDLEAAHTSMVDVLAIIAAEPTPDSRYYSLRS